MHVILCGLALLSSAGGLWASASWAAQLLRHVSLGPDLHQPASQPDSCMAKPAHVKGVGGGPFGLYMLPIFLWSAACCTQSSKMAHRAADASTLHSVEGQPHVSWCLADVVAHAQAPARAVRSECS